jgi:hypothetical protein
VSLVKKVVRQIERFESHLGAEFQELLSRRGWVRTLHRCDVLALVEVEHCWAIAEVDDSGGTLLSVRRGGIIFVECLGVWGSFEREAEQLVELYFGSHVVECLVEIPEFVNCGDNRRLRSDLIRSALELTVLPHGGIADALVFPLTGPRIFFGKVPRDDAA